EHDLPGTAFAGEHDDEVTPTPTTTPIPEALPPKSLASPRAAASPEVARRDPTLTPTPESGLGRSRRATAADSGPFMVAPPSLQGGTSTTSRANATPQPSATQRPEATLSPRIEVALR